MTNDTPSRSSLWPALLLLVLVLAIPIVPFVLCGEQLEAQIEAWCASPPAPWLVALAVVGLLASDILLPIPSSAVSTLAGHQLGFVGGTLASWLGLTLGAIGGFALARRWGGRLVTWLTKPADAAKTTELLERWGPMLLVIGRGIPILAEATVLLVGAHQLTWRRFLLPVALANLGLAVAYAGLGQLSRDYNFLPIALALSLALPALFMLGFRWKK